MKYPLLIVFIFLLNKDIPQLNQKVLEYVGSVVGKQVGSGECWDLAAGALEYAGAFLDRSNQKNIYVFGAEINPKKDNIFPGDIIQFENVKLEYKKGNAIYTETMLHHTAIIYEVIEKGHFNIAHQNTSFGGKKVSLSNFKLNDVLKGKITFYRPLKK